jgi:hypothetical protein
MAVNRPARRHREAARLMASTSWWVNATTNSAGKFNKVWVTTNGNGANVIAGPYNTEASAKAAAAKVNGLQSITGWRGTIAELGAGANLLINPGSGSACLWTLPLVGCVIKKTQMRAILGGLIIGASGLIGLVAAAVLISKTAAGSAAAQKAGGLAGGALEGVGLAASVVGAPEVGVAIAGAGHSVRKASKGGKGKPSAAGRAASSRAVKAKQNRAEDQELSDKGASNVRTAKKPPGTLGPPNRPGRVVESRPGPNGTRPRAKTSSTDKPPF